MKRLLFALFVLGSLVGALAQPAATPDAVVNINAAQPGVKVSPTLWGIFYEEINHAGDGGIYSEMVQNRAFEETQPAAGAKMVDNQMVTPKGFRYRKWYRDELQAWSTVADGGAKVGAALDTAFPLNEMTPHSLRLEVDQVGTRAGVANEGYWGMGIEKGETYNLSFYVRTADDARQTITATLENADGTKQYAKATVSKVGGDWKRYACSLKANANDPKARLALCVSKPGTLWLDVVSLFPRDTFKNRPNGLRRDIAEALQKLHPAFVRFPGGCVVEGVTLENRIQWKRTIGDIAQRPGRWDLWGYHNTEGLGFHEYLQLCEDLGAAPLYVANAGMSCFFRNAEIVTDPEQLKPYVQDTLDALEYANGPVTSKWGAERAKNGHPKPFNIQYVEIGNENWGDDYFRNYRYFYDAIKAKYPDIITIADCPIPNAPVEVIDEHYYVEPGWFFANSHKYDSYSRTGPNIYVGEYACNSGVGAGNLLAGISEAAFMIGMERNSDVVTMASYAPLFENVHNREWPVNLILFDSSRVVGRSSYQVQVMFAANRPDVTLPTDVVEPRKEAPKPVGTVGVGTWNTRAEFKDIKVERDGQVLFASDFAKGTEGWKLEGGNWSTADGALRQGSDDNNVRATVAAPGWSDYTLILKARKLGGAEGFLVIFQAKDSQDYAWWNVGGWGNTRNAIEQSVGGAKHQVGESPAGSVETGRWYDVKVEVQGNKVACYLDGKLVQKGELEQKALPGIYALGGTMEKSGQIIIKAVNPGATPLATTFRIQGASGIKSRARVITLSGKPGDENTLDNPTKVVPVESTFEGAGAEFRYTLKPCSLTILRLER